MYFIGYYRFILLIFKALATINN